jgi:CheY-like chemotaxis protein
MEGLEKLKSSLFDLTLCDFLMPIMDGLDCVQQYRDWEKYHRPWISQRIVGMSAHATPGDVEKGLKVGMDDFRNKPVTFKSLSELIQCEQQKEMSNRLDEMELREASMRNLENRNKQNSATPSLIDGRPCTCLIIAPKREEEHIKLLEETIKSWGWQSATAGTDGDALTWLKMRMWDLVLVDEAFAPAIVSFREWESKKRKKHQRRVNLMTDVVDATMAHHIEVGWSRYFSGA